MAELLDTALVVAKSKWSSSTFSKAFAVKTGNESTIKLEIKQGRFFSTNKVYLIIHRSTPQDVYINIFLKGGHEL